MCRTFPTHPDVGDDVDLEQRGDDGKRRLHVARVGQDGGQAAEEDVELREDAGPQGHGALQRHAAEVGGEVGQSDHDGVLGQVLALVQTLSVGNIATAQSDHQ